MRSTAKPVQNSQDDGYDAYRASAKSWFKMAEEYMGYRPLDRIYNGYADVTDISIGKKRQEAVKAYAQAINHLLLIPDTSRNNKDNVNLGKYFEGYAKAHDEVGLSAVASLLQEQAKKYQKNVEAISDSSEVEGKSEVKSQKRKIDLLEEDAQSPSHGAKGKSIFRPVKRARTDEKLKPDANVSRPPALKK